MPPLTDLAHMIASVGGVLAEAARRTDPELPGFAESVGEVVFGVAEGGRSTLGWYSRDTWRQGTTWMPEIVLNAAFLDRPAEKIMTTLLHEAVHSYAEAVALPHVSRNGRYHNNGFGRLAGGCPDRCGNWVTVPLRFRLLPDRTRRV